MSSTFTAAQSAMHLTTPSQVAELNLTLKDIERHLVEDTDFVQQLTQMGVNLVEEAHGERSLLVALAALMRRTNREEVNTVVIQHNSETGGFTTALSSHEPVNVILAEPDLIDEADITIDGTDCLSWSVTTDSDEVAVCEILKTQR